MTIKVTRSVLQNAASVVGLLLTTEALVTEIPEKESRNRGTSNATGWNGRHGLLTDSQNNN